MGYPKERAHFGQLCISELGIEIMFQIIFQQFLLFLASKPMS